MEDKMKTQKKNWLLNPLDFIQGDGFATLEPESEIEAKEIAQAAISIGISRPRIAASAAKADPTIARAVHREVFGVLLTQSQ
jgi:hypothetical protein